MLRWAFGFLLLAFVAALFGMAGIAGISVTIAWVLFLAFLFLFVVTALVNVFSGRRTPPPL